jgi:predicted nucleotidyltransferase
MRTLEEIQKILTHYKPIIQEKYKVSELGIFGSYVRGEQHEESADVQVLWKTTQQDVPQLKVLITKVMEQALQNEE